MAQVFSCRFCEISKNTLLTELLWTTASDFICGVFFMFAIIRNILLEKSRLVRKSRLLENRLYLKCMLSDVLIVVMWPKWVHKHLQEATKSVFSREKLYIDFMILLTKYFTLILKTMILTALVNSVAGTQIFEIQKHPKNGLRHWCFSVNFV